MAVAITVGWSNADGLVGVGEIRRDGLGDVADRADLNDGLLGLLENQFFVDGAHFGLLFKRLLAADTVFFTRRERNVVLEVANTGVHIVCVCPGFTRTDFQAKANIDASAIPQFAWMSADAVADQAVRGANRSGVLVNGTMNSLTTVLMRLAPRSLVARMVAATMRGGA